MLGFGSGYKFTVECKSFYQTSKKIKGTPIYELDGINFNTLESESDGLDGILIDVEEIK